MRLIPKDINPNLCDGNEFGCKSLLIILVLLVSNANLPLKFIEQYKSKINFDYQDKNGKTALHYAVILGRAEIVSVLLSHHASDVLADLDGKCAFDYLNCKPDKIKKILKQIHIEPFRDVMAKRNMLGDHEGQPLFLQGVKVVQSKNVLENILSNEKICLIQYLTNTPFWASCIGDDTDATRIRVEEIAGQLAFDHNQPFSDVWIDKPLPPSYHSQFNDYIHKLNSCFLGKSILEVCIEGHQLIESQLLESAVSSLSL